MVDTLDLKSNGQTTAVRVQVPLRVRNSLKISQLSEFFYCLNFIIFLYSLVALLLEIYCSMLMNDLRPPDVETLSIRSYLPLLLDQVRHDFAERGFSLSEKRKSRIL